MTRDEKLYMAKSIYDAFVEGYNSYATPAAAYNSVSQAWEESAAKELRDKLVAEANEGLSYENAVAGAIKRGSNKKS